MTTRGTGPLRGPWRGLGPAAVERLGLPPDRSWRAHVAGEYRYLSRAYYDVLDAELAGAAAIPSPADALDASIAPVALERAARAGVRVAASDMATERFPDPPFLAIPVNPFQRDSELILDATALAARRGGLTYNGNYAALCIPLPPDGRIDRVRVVLGRCSEEVLAGVETMAAAVASTFRVPLFRMRVVVAADGVRFAGIEPLRITELGDAEMRALDAETEAIDPEGPSEVAP